jgi:hypothetical protein
MSALPIREQFLREIDSLSDGEISALLQTIRLLKGTKTSSEAVQTTVKPPYDPAKDKMRQGIFDGPPDLAEKSSEILRRELGVKKPQDET